MHVCLAICCTLIWADTAKLSSPSCGACEAGATVPSVQAILREASELALKQGAEEHLWTDRVLLTIGELQARAGDYDGALRSIRGSGYPHGRQIGLLHLTQALALAGQKERALEVSLLLDSDSGW